MSDRLNKKFQQLKEQDKRAFVSYQMACDPDYKTSLDLMKEFASSGVNIIELGMPFSDPMAEGPAIQKAAKRSLQNECNLDIIFKLLKDFREGDKDTPVILMGYYNPVFSYGVEKFMKAALEAGADGFIIVDLPPEEEEELTRYSKIYNLPLIKLTTPTTDEQRAEKILQNSGGFVYHVSVAGVTGQKEAVKELISSKIDMLRNKTDLPICTGFGIKTPEAAKDIAEICDGIVIGSAFVRIIEDNLNKPEKIISLSGELAAKVRKAIDEI